MTWEHEAKGGLLWWEMTELIRARGLDGWELVTLFEEEDGGYAVAFKRPLPLKRSGEGHG